jgi:hypothetical protein
MISERMHSSGGTEKNYETIHLRSELGLSSEDLTVLDMQFSRLSVKDVFTFRLALF